MLTPATPQLSFVAGIGNTIVAPQIPVALFTLLLAIVIVGNSLSITVMACLAVSVLFPCISVTVHVTIVVPTGK